MTQSDPSRSLIERLSSLKVIPVVILDDADTAEPLAEALAAGGMGCIEITLRTPQAVQALERTAKKSSLFLGAGTVLTLDQAKQAQQAGAQFIVTPGTSEPIIEYCLSQNLPVLPGAGNATDLQRCSQYGLTLCKFFPAEALGGIPMLKALSAPFPRLRFNPTGGIRKENLSRYLELPQVVACGGSWLAPPNLLKEGQWDAIRKNCEETLALL